MVSLGIRMLGVGALVGLYALSPIIGVIALGTVFGCVVTQYSRLYHQEVESSFGPADYRRTMGRSFSRGLRGAVMRWLRGSAAVLVMLLALSSSTYAQEPSLKIGNVPYLVLISGQSTDAWTTSNFLRDGTGRESNQWVGQHPKKMLFIKSAAVVSLAFEMKLAEYAANKKHSRAILWTGRLIGYGGGAFGAWAALHNQWNIPAPPCFACR